MLKDWRGNEIKSGSIIVYPGRSGSSMWMSEGNIVGIEYKPMFSWDSSNIVPHLKVDVGGVITTIKRIDRVTVVGQKKIDIKVNYSLEDLKDIK